MATIGTLVAHITGDTSGLHRAERDAKKHCGGIENTLKNMKRIAITAFAGWGVTQLAQNVISVSNSFTLYKQTLETLEGTHARATQKWDELLEFAEKTPFKIAQVMDSYKTLKAFGLDPTIKSMTILGDTAAALGGGDVLGRIALVLGQIQAQGRMTAQDMNQLANAGINAGKVMKEAFGAGRDEVAKLAEQGIGAREVIEALLNEMTVKFGGQMEKLNKTLAGQWEELQSIWERFQVSIMEAGLDKYLTGVLVDLNRELNRLRTSGQLQRWAESIGTAVSDAAKSIMESRDIIIGFFKDLGVAGKAIYDSTVPALNALKGALSGLVAVYKSLPSDVVAVGGAGLVGRILFGTQGAVILAGLAAIDRLKVETFPKPYEEHDWLTRKGVEFLAWFNDVDIAAKRAMGSFVELHTAQGSIWVKRSDMDAYLNSLDKIDDVTDSVADDTKNLADSFVEMQSAADKANEELEKYYKELDKSKSIMAGATLAALPEFQRGIEIIVREYDAWNTAIEKNAEIAGYSTEQIAGLHADLALRMDEDISEYIKSHTECTEEIDTLWTNAMDRVQSTMADTFMDAFQGHLTSAQDIFKSFCDILLRYWAEMLAQMAMQSGVLKGITSGLGSAFGTLFGGLGSLFGGGPSSGSGGMGAVGQGLQGASSAWSLQQAYGAYNTAGGGIAGLRAGAGSFFGVGGGASTAGASAASWSMVGGFPTATIGTAGTGVATQSMWSTVGTYAGYAGAGAAIGMLVNSIRGHDVEHPEYATYGGAAGGLAGGFIGGAALGSKMGSWGGWIGVGIGAILGGLIGSFMGGSKKRSYLTREYDYGYGLAGWEETGMIETREKRKGEDFREAAEGMSASVVNILNSFDELTTGFLEIVDDKWVNQFKTSMMELEELGFEFKISAEDKGEFKDDMRSSFAAALQGVINPVVSVAVDFMRQATEEAFTSPEIEKVFDILNENVAGFLREDMAEVLAIFDAPLPTTQKEFEAFVESLGANLEEIGAILDYFQIITDVTTEISKGLARTSLTQSLIDINANFLALGETLVSLGIDLEKYPDYVEAWGIALVEATYGFSADNIVEELKKIMDAPSAIEAAEQFTLGFMQQVRDGMVNAITSAFTEMMYMQMLAPLAEAFLESAETPEELLVAAKQYIGAVAELMRDPDMIAGLQEFGAAMWEINQMIPSAEQLAGFEDYGAQAGDLIVEGAVQAGQEMDAGGISASHHLIAGGQTAAQHISNAAKAFANVGITAAPMATGAIVTRPTYSLTGEAGPEVVLPLDNQHKLIAKLDKGAQETVITIPLTVVTEDGRVLKREIIRETFSEIEERSRRREFVVHAAGVS